ncbi:hypothetical protein RIF29_15704 [Crotalaria pallida]|uniref:Uncharacterized protein n=1 Tax=Crotalaria pallida TaxID=3830 RepID=A0AAN9FMB6_CROPI
MIRVLLLLGMCLMNLCRSVCARYSLFVPKFVEMRDKLIVEIERSNAIDADANIGDATRSSERVQDPSSNYSRKKSTRRCSVCHVRGDNKRSCPGLYDNEVFDDEHLDDTSAQELDDDAADRTSLVDDDSDDFSSDGFSGDDYKEDDESEHSEEDEDH